MNEIKFYIASAIFVVLTAIKIAMPALSDSISQEISKVLITEHEQTTTVAELGASIVNGNIFEVFDRDKEDWQLIPVKEIIDYERILPKPAETKTTEEPEPDFSPKVEAFMQSQEPYSDYAVPANVSYEMPDLPFEYTCPVQGTTSSGFGYRIHPIANDVRYHYGTDFSANTGEDVLAFADGVIRAAGEDGSFGKYIIIDHEGGYSTLYAHCSQLCVSSGTVSRGEVIARVGSSGAATGPHLHFELMQGEIYLNPEFYL